MQELSLNILDIAQNSVVANATLIEIGVEVDTDGRIMTITVKDNGKGMDRQALANVTNPFFTSRTTRKVGLGVPLFKMAAEQTGGSFSIDSTVGVGTLITAVFDTDSIDFMPLGDIRDTVGILIQMNENLDFVYTAKKGEDEFVCDTREIREIMEGVPLSEVSVVQWIKGFIEENQFEIFKRRY